MESICRDLAAEHADLARIVSALDDDAWDAPTPAAGWNVRDQLSHLWYFDRAAVLALTDPEAFGAEREALLADGRGTEVSVEPGRSMAASALRSAWAGDAAELVRVGADVDPATRVPWYGPAMGARSFLTARLMETWAHGQDIVDAVGADRPATARLRHIAHIGIGARPFSYLVRGRQVPPEPVYVALQPPGGEAGWAWGPADAVDRVTGSALDFCLLVTQRRHRDDLDLVVEGPVAEDWVGIAQAFAGPPGPGRARRS